MTAVRVFLSLGGRKTVIVGAFTFVIHFAALVGASEGSRPRSGPIVPKSPGTVPGQIARTCRSSAASTSILKRKADNKQSRQQPARNSERLAMGRVLHSVIQNALR